MDIQVQDKALSGVAKINILLGKNGSGKSTLLRILEEQKQQLPNLGIARYITPERGGQLAYEAGIDTTIANDPGWADRIRRNNRYDNFRQMSVSEYRRLETLVLRQIEKDTTLRQNLAFSFDSTLTQINSLLDNVMIVRGANTGFDIKAKAASEDRSAQMLSSGESELISLAIEILAFVYGAETHKNKTSYLLLDEPDVHLHPDLQERLMGLLANAVANRNIVVLIATHSTAILGALSDNKDAHVGFIATRQNTVKFSPIGETLKHILPIFGAHPLSNVFNKNPILLVEGEDDERIWQQAVRSSQGKLQLWPCAAGDIQSLDDYENEVEGIAGAVYDDAKAFSLRDRDDYPYEIDDKVIVKRMRLYCRASENLLLTDDVLASLGTDWQEMTNEMDFWLEQYHTHSQYEDMKRFKAEGYSRQVSDIKSLRNILMMLAGSQKPWEVAVGQAIAGLLSSRPLEGEHSLTAYLGPKLVDTLGLRPPRRTMISKFL